MMKRNLDSFQAKLKIRFQQPKLLRQAFTHSSYVNEHQGKEKHNERLEFLGDAVLELAVTEYLFERYKGHSEGKLTRMRASLVCESSLVKLAESLDFGLYVLLGKGEEQTGGRTRPALLADLFESFVGALYLDQGYAAVKRFLEKTMFAQLDMEQAPKFVDYKTMLQEHVQQSGAASLEYRIVDEKGPAHDREFAVELYMDDTMIGRGKGRSKKEAEQQAAGEALAQLSGRK